MNPRGFSANPLSTSPFTEKRRHNLYHHVLVTFFILILIVIGCRTPTQYRIEADEVAKEIIREKQEQVLNRAELFEIERPSNTLRRRLLTEQNLPYASEASLGSDKLRKLEHWPDKGYPDAFSFRDQVVTVEAGEPLRLSLVQALQIGARNSFDYQTSKENVFRAALDLDLERNEFRNIFKGQVETLIRSDLSGNEAVTGSETRIASSLSRTLESGAKLTAHLALDLAKLLTQSRSSSIGILGDATITLPLLRGSGTHIIMEPAMQAERNVIYAIWEFERFRQILAVDIAKEYLDVLRRLNEIENAAENYRNLIVSSRRSRRLADAGRATEVEVNQALQNELRARSRWVSARECYKGRMDAFKRLLGLPPDADILLDRDDLDQLLTSSFQISNAMDHESGLSAKQEVPHADTPIDLVEPGDENAGPMEMDAFLAKSMALENRLDLKIAEGKVYDAQRKAIVAADALGAEVTLFGRAALGEGRTIATSDLDNAKFRMRKGVYSALFTIDLPFERTAERNAYRNSLITLEKTVRDVQRQEDEIKLSIRNRLREMYEARESRQIQARALRVAETRVKSTTLFFEAGRIQIRDLLEAQEALVNARNALTSAIVDYRIAELEFQRDAGVLRIDDRGLWVEYSPLGLKDGK
jgi:outer membrane protein TolC